MENKDLQDREALRDQIMKHFSEPKFLGLTGKGQIYESKSEVCSDAVTLEVSLEGETVTDAHFKGEGCAIALAAADTFCQVILGRTKAEILTINNEYQKMLKNEPYDEKTLGELVIFRQIHGRRSRVACAKLPTIGLEIFLNFK